MGHLVELMAKATRDFADAIAIETPVRSTTYRDLLLAAESASAELRTRSARTVALEGERDEKLIAFILGAIMAQCTLVLVDPALPKARREEMLSIAEADIHVIVKDGNVAIHQRNLVLPASHGDYIFFTSGTTGRPKAISGRWDSVAHFVSWQAQSFGIGKGDRIAQLTGVAFDVFLRDVFTPLTSGATVCIPPATLIGTGRDVTNWLRDARINVIHVVPSLAARWLTAAGVDNAESQDLRLTFFAGEPLTDTIVCSWRELYPATTVVNLYGPTETTLAKFSQIIEVPAAGLQPVGQPLPGTRVRIVGEEIWISTPYGTNGYVNAEADAVASFVTDEAGDTWYRTGDVGRIDDDGVLWVLGRKDLQVKINGNRVEPEGIAATLSQHPALSHVVVVAAKRDDGSPYLACYYTAPSGPYPSGKIVEWLTERVPAAHIPSVFQYLTDMPTTPNGKINRPALPHPQIDTGEIAPTESEPLTDVEAAVLGEFRFVLESKRVHMRSDFFAHGGTSMDAVELTVRLESVTQRSWLMSDVYRLRTPRAIADDVERRPLTELVSIPTLDPQPETLGLSPQQRRYREVYLPRINRSWSNMVALFALPDGVETDAVAHALETIVRRHDSLRAFFQMTPTGDLLQYFPDDLAIDLHVADLSGTPDEQEAQIDLLRLSDANAVIDITHAPLFRATLIRHHSQRRTLLWNVHHMVSDGYSQRLLNAELTHLLSGADPAELPEMPISYRDYIVWAAESGPADVRKQELWWREVYAIPYERPLLPSSRDVVDGAGGVAYQFPIPPSTVKAIDEFCRRVGATPFTVFLTALFAVGYEMYGRDDLVIGTPAAGRQRAEFETMIGNFISLVGVRVHAHEGDSFADRVRLVRDRTTAAMENQNYQYDEVMKIVGAEPDDDRFPLTTIFLSLLDVPAAPHDTAHYRELGSEVKFDLMGYLKRYEGKLWLEMQTRRELLTHEQLEQWGERLIRLLDQGLTEADSAT